MELNRLESITQTQASSGTSDKYSFIPTTRVIERLALAGWHPRKAMQARTRLEENRGFQKHIIRFARQSDLSLETEFPEIVLINSHCGSSSFKLMLGIFRCVCLNGLVTGDKFESHAIRHIGYTDSAVDQAIRGISTAAPLAIEQLREFKQIELNKDEQEAYASAAIELKFDGEQYAVDPRQLLYARRMEDRAPTLWNTFNKVQEAIVKGGVRQVRPDGSRIRSRQIKNIDEDVRVNRALWMLTEKMAAIKGASLN